MQAATHLFAERGYHGTSLQQIADAAGVTKAAIYHHFRTKEDVAEAVITPALEAVTAIVRTASAHAQPRAQIEAAIIGMADQAVQHRSLWSIVLQDPAMKALLGDGNPHAQSFERLPKLLLGPTRTAQRQMLVSVFLSGLMGPALDRSSRELDPEAASRAIAEAGRRLLLD